MPFPLLVLLISKSFGIFLQGLVGHQMFKHY